MRIRFLSLAFFLVFFSGVPSGQAAEHDFNTWWNLNLVKKVGDGPWTVFLENHVRFGDDSSQLAQVILRPGVGYALNSSLSLWAGYGFVATKPPFSGSDITDQELWQHLLWSRDLGSFRLTSRTRLEQRFREDSDDFRFRFRQFFRLSRPLSANSKTQLVLRDEVFFLLNENQDRGDNGFKANWFFLGLNRRFSSIGVVEAGYLNTLSYNPNGEDGFNHALSVSVGLSL